jgi:hypothetical protein
MRTILNHNQDPMKLLASAAILALFAASACEPRAASGDATAGTPAAPDTTMLPGTPAGDLTEWVADMRFGLDSAEAVLSTDRADVQRRVLILYATRQEYLEGYYGPTGRMGPSPELGQAVKTAEDRFHDLMQLTAANPPAEESAIKAAIEAVDKQLAQVLELKDRTQRHLRATAQ